MKNALRFAVALLALVSALGHADEVAPKVLFDPAQTGAVELITANEKFGDTSFVVTNDAVVVSVKAGGKSSFPGIVVTPKPAWDATGFGHLETTVTNTGTNRFRINLRIDNEGRWQDDPFSAGSVALNPGETKTVAAIFGYSSTKKAYALKPDAIVRAIIFTGKSPGAQSFRITTIRAAGPVGEKPYIDPNTVAVKPPGGVLFPGKDTVAKAGANKSVLFKPAAGMWNLNEDLQVRVKLRNTNSAPVTASVQLQSRGGTSTNVSKQIPAGGTAEIVVPFMAAVPWKGACLPAMLEADGPAHSFDETEPNTGTKFASNTTTGIQVTGAVEVVSIVADMPERKPLPAWLGKRPPVEGEWTLTFDENFDGDAIDLTKWSIYTEGEWHLGKATGFSKDNVIVKDGKLALRVEKRKVHHNDNPAYPLHDYATGWAETLGKWTQRYGYFEARVKLPAVPDQFTAFWLMPDRGLEYAQKKQTAYGEKRNYQRNSTNGHGMEFDIMEQLSIWGPNRHDFGMHWDHYMKNHKSLGTFGCYFQPDDEGFLTVGMLWTPGSIVMYQQGREAARWECSRISDLPSYLILQHITGGWETDGMDDSQLPSDLVFDYVRVWQRKDLASPVDGPKPNKGTPGAPTNEP
jgi:beta-glucanase (GH16 family)